VDPPLGCHCRRTNTPQLLRTASVFIVSFPATTSLMFLRLFPLYTTQSPAFCQGGVLFTVSEVTLFKHAVWIGVQPSQLLCGPLDETFLCKFSFFLVNLCYRVKRSGGLPSCGSTEFRPTLTRVCSSKRDKPPPSLPLVNFFGRVEDSFPFPLEIPRYAF